MHQQVYMQKEYVDLWEYYEPGYTRQLPTTRSLWNHALSPSTEQVLWTSDENSVEMRVRGPEGKMVWFDLPYEAHGSMNTFMNLQILRMELTIRHRLEYS